MMRVGLDAKLSEAPTWEAEGAAAAPPLLLLFAPPAADATADADSGTAFMVVDWLLLLLAMVVAIVHQ